MQDRHITTTTTDAATTTAATAACYYYYYNKIHKKFNCLTGQNKTTTKVCIVERDDLFQGIGQTAVYTKRNEKNG